jgi:hypothetical protein
MENATMHIVRFFSIDNDSGGLRFELCVEKLQQYTVRDSKAAFTPECNMQHPT